MRIMQPLTRHERRTAALERAREESRKRDLAMMHQGAGYGIDRAIRLYAARLTAVAADSAPPFGADTNIRQFVYRELVKGRAVRFELRRERDHVFDLVDFLDWSTDGNLAEVSLRDSLSAMQDGKIYNYSIQGSPSDITLTAIEGRPFAISGISITRRGDRVSWILLGGEYYDESQWAGFCAPATSPVHNSLPREALETDSVETVIAAGAGVPMPLEGTETFHKTIVGSVVDLRTATSMARFIDRH